LNAERQRLKESAQKIAAWKKWGPYLSERQWGTVREDYSDTGNAWDYFTHDQARSRAYRWGEDGLAGYSDEKQRLCFALCLWNGKDSILKERLFGLSNSEANHGEDVKEYYFYLDSTPTHSYMKYLYKYPQTAFPYEDLVKTNRQRSREEFEYELLDTGVFDQDRYFDAFVEYAKESPDDTLIKITVFNRGPDPSMLHVLPTLWFHNTWSWSHPTPKPVIKVGEPIKGVQSIIASHEILGDFYLYCEGAASLLFTENETNDQRFFGIPNRNTVAKDGINNYIVNGDKGAVNPAQTGTKAAADYQVPIPGGGSQVIRLRLTNLSPQALLKANGEADGTPFGKHFDDVFDIRKKEADAFYEGITPKNMPEDQVNVMRQALAGMLWSKQYYYFDLDYWLEEHEANPLLEVKRKNVRNMNWVHMLNDDIISMPDKWEYPWYAAWDLAFHTQVLNMVDPEFSKEQLGMMLREVYLHPSGQIPAYEWNFGDVNPPVHAWATMFNYNVQKQLHGKGDLEFLKNAFQKLLLNFTWWVNRKDPAGKNVFEGGFLGLDNIGVFDRSAKLPTGGSLEQADGTAWMAFYSVAMAEMAMELALHDPVYEDMVLKFLEHFFLIAGSMDRVGEHKDELWDEEDGFFYDVLRMPDGTAQRLKVRSLVGLLPLCATITIPPEFIKRFPNAMERIQARLKRRPGLMENIASPIKPGVSGRRLLSVLSEAKLRRVLEKMLDEERFLSPYGIRSLSRWHKDHPYIFDVNGEEYKVAYLPAESNTGMFGGNSNWRGPIWMPINDLLVRSMLQFYAYYGDDFKIECPTGSGRLMTLFEVAKELSDRLSRIYLRDEVGHRPVYGGNEKFQSDPYWRDYILFYEYYHGDNGAGLGASHQTGWSGLVARFLQYFSYITPADLLSSDMSASHAVYLED